MKSRVKEINELIVVFRKGILSYKQALKDASCISRDDFKILRDTFVDIEGWQCETNSEVKKYMMCYLYSNYKYDLDRIACIFGNTQGYIERIVFGYENDNAAYKLKIFEKYRVTEKDKRNAKKYIYAKYGIKLDRPKRKTASGITFTGKEKNFWRTVS